MYQFFEILAFSRFLVLPRSRLFAKIALLAASLRNSLKGSVPVVKIVYLGIP